MKQIIRATVAILNLAIGCASPQSHSHEAPNAGKHAVND